jgi:putative 4-mercaptohistidine N1-methyltranferase
MSALYESDELLAQYLLLHYGSQAEVMPYEFGPLQALHYPVRCAQELIRASGKIEHGRALELGCAVGRSSFELARYCREVSAMDFSQRFIQAADALKETGSLAYGRTEEGELATPLRAKVAEGIERSRISFWQGDACALPHGLGVFDLVLMANLIDRLPDPQSCLSRLAGLVASGGMVLITSPHTWMEDFTPKAKWLGGRDGKRTLEGLKENLSPSFDLVGRKDLPFLIREHARKFQWSVAEATFWKRKDD